MPLKLNVGLSRKVGEANFGSRGASVNLELELDSGLAGEPERLHDRIRQLFRLAKESVDNELNGGQTLPAAVNGSSNGRNGNGAQPATNGHVASQKQIDYVQRLACQVNGLGFRRLEALAEKMFGKPVAGLTSSDASGLIDCLKAINASEITYDFALTGAAECVSR